MRGRSPNLATVHAAAAEQNRPLAPGESVPWLPVQAYVDEHGMRHVWRIVGDLAELEPQLYNRFLGERTLADLVIETLVELDSAPSWREFCDAITQIADEQGRWTIAVPIANLMPPGSYVEVGSQAGLGLATQERDWSRTTSTPALDPSRNRHPPALEAAATWPRPLRLAARRARVV